MRYRNPYLEAFGKYVERRDEWEPKEPKEPKGNSREMAIKHSSRFDFDALSNVFIVKDVLRHRCAYAIPDDAAIDAIVALKLPVVEIGAGAGYWAWMLEQAGVEVKAFDYKPTDKNEYCSDDHWTEVHHGNVGVLRHPPGAYSTHALMLCWPPYDTPMAIDCLRAYRGDTLIYIGEGYGGCTGDDAFHQELEAHWTTETTVEIPQWPMIHDYLSIHRRS